MHRAREIFQRGRFTGRSFCSIRKQMGYPDSGGHTRKTLFPRVVPRPSRRFRINRLQEERRIFQTARYIGEKCDVIDRLSPLPRFANPRIRKSLNTHARIRALYNFVSLARSPLIALLFIYKRTFYLIGYARKFSVIMSTFSSG